MQACEEREIKARAARSVESTAPGVSHSSAEADPPETAVVQFVVDPSGRADMSTFTLVRPADPALVQLVRRRLPTMRFMPATLRGEHVKQLVQMPFFMCP